MGASEFYACLGNEEKMKELAGRFDVIIDASPVNVDVGLYLVMLKFNGVYCRVGIPEKTNQNFNYNFIPLICTQKKIAGSVVTGTYRMKRMFELVSGQPGKFLADPDFWKIKKVPFDQLNQVMKELLDGKNTENYRYVLEW
jgi:D-arabinose 1-dehydrogenase-like Zn-dependent alcohol dehydrogenase